MDLSSLGTFVDIAYQCLQETREQRPTMSVVVKNLKDALEFKRDYDLKLQREHEAEQRRKAAEHKAEPRRKAAEQEYKEILKSADPPLRFLEFPVNGGKTLLSINDKGEVFCERICIEACLDRIQYRHLQDPYGFENSRFSGARCYYKDEGEWKVRVRAQFLYPGIRYTVNLVFRNDLGNWPCKTLHYRLDGETKCCMVYDTYEREDGWFVVPFYEFTSDRKTANFEIDFEGYPESCRLQVAGFKFQTLEEKVELHDQGIKEYQEIVNAASQSLFYKCSDELKKLLAIGFHINNHKTWFSLNEDGEHCEMLSIADCLIPREGGYSFSYTERYSRFPHFYYTRTDGFKVHIKAQFLTPSIRYTVNLVFRKDNSSEKQKYVGLRYKLEGEITSSIVYLATETKDNNSFIAEFYQFNSTGRAFDLKIVFKDHKHNLIVEGILFQPLEKVEHGQLLEYEEQSNDSLQWKMEENLFTNLLKCFGIYDDQEGYAVDNNGKKSMMFSARGAIRSDHQSFKSSPQSRFGEVAVIRSYFFHIEKKIKSDLLSPETAYATYLIYKLPQHQSNYKFLLKITNYNGRYLEYPYIFLVSPQEAPIIGEKLDQNTHKPWNRDKVYAVSRPRKDGWMEVKVSEFQTPSSTEAIHRHISLSKPSYIKFDGLIIESIEVRPILLGMRR